MKQAASTGSLKLGTDPRARLIRQLQLPFQIVRRLDLYVELLCRWSKITDLVADATPPVIWARHIEDSAQILELAPDATRWLDLGSGAGFPGMVIAILLSENVEAVVHCVESNRRKCAFLRQVARQTTAPANVHGSRIETLSPDLVCPVDAVTARALAPLPKLFEFSKVWIERGAVAIFPRGRTLPNEVPTLTAESRFDFEMFSSRTDPSSGIVRIRRKE